MNVKQIQRLNTNQENDFASCDPNFRKNVLKVSQISFMDSQIIVPDIVNRKTDSCQHVNHDRHPVKPKHDEM